ncbi:MAG: sugar transferase [Candidatus Schekmanbacteria bacterium]|nr:sugar transferase [Candidatus Schekmanbacteria bacterium]
MLRERAGIFAKLYKAFDLGITALAFFAAYQIRTHWESHYLKPLPSFSSFLWLLYIIFPLWAFLLEYQGVYQSHRLETFFKYCWRITKALVFGVLALSSILFLLKKENISRSFILLFLIIDWLALMAGALILKGILHIVRRKGYNHRNILIVGTGKRAQEFAEMIQKHNQWGLKIAGFIDKDPEKLGKPICGIKVIDVLENLPVILHNQVIDEVFFIVPRKWLSILEDSMLACEEMGIKTRLAGDIFPHKIAKTYFTDLNGHSLLTFDPTPHHQDAIVVKRILDVTVSALALALSWPLLLLIAAAVKLGSRGPVLFRQTRCGVNGKLFTVLKFRTMVNDAEKLKAQIQHMNEMDGPVFKVKNDPRITGVGNFLRKTSLDELPQLFNVLKGDMSLVGPRPPLPSEVKQYDRWQRRRLSMRPGLTCLWQVNGRNNLDFEKWMRLDLEYIDNWSLGLDMRIMLKTVPALVRGTGV